MDEKETVMTTTPLPLLKPERMMVFLADEGRAVLWVKTERGPAWLELLPEDRAWLVERLRDAVTA